MTQNSGIKIKNISAAILYDISLGIKDYFPYQEAMFNNSLFSLYLRRSGMDIYSGKRNRESTRDLICLDFDFGSRSYQEELKRLTGLLNASLTDEARNHIENNIRKIQAQKDLYCEKNRSEIRELFYNEGVSITYQNKQKDGSVKKEETIHYKMLFRTSAKAKLGQVIFINENLYEKAYDWLTIGLGCKMAHNNAKIVEMSAYAPLTTSTIMDTVHIPVEDILILKDQTSAFRTTANVVRAAGYTGKNGNRKKKCIVNKEETEVQNTIWDGMGIIESSLLPDHINGMALLRNHLFKMCGMRGHLQRFFQDWCEKNGKDYNTFQVQDMFGKWHYLKDIKMITTESAIKWTKFADLMGGTLPCAYSYWCSRVHADGDIWGIVKTDHPSKFGDCQQLSYQMLNTLPCTKEDMKNIAQTSMDYVCLLKRDNDAFEAYLRKNANTVNHYEMLADLYARNHEFADCKWFRNEKSEIIKSYIRRLRKGKIVVHGDNLTVFGNPYALLLYAVGDDWKKDDTLLPEKGCVQCFTTRFGEGEYLAAFRNPHNSPNNICYMHNTAGDKLQRYFTFSPNIVAINCIHTDIQDRANGMDEDSDFMLFTNHPSIVACAKRSYREYPTIVNALKESTITYHNTKSDYAAMDHKLSGSKMGIGWSSNLAQLALTYYWTEKAKTDPDQEKIKELYDSFIILSVIAQIIIDGCKRDYEIDGTEEIRRISRLSCMTLCKETESPDPGGAPKPVKCDYPLFMKYIKEMDPTKGGRINPSLQCPMNWLEECLDEIPRPTPSKTVPTGHFFIKMEGSANRRQISRIQTLIMEYDNKIKTLKCRQKDGDESYVEKLKEYSLNVIEELSKIKIGNPVTINRLIETALGLEKNNNQKYYKKYESKYTRKTLNCLYQMDRDKFLRNFI